MAIQNKGPASSGTKLASVVPPIVDHLHAVKMALSLPHNGGGPWQPTCTDRSATNSGVNFAAHLPPGACSPWPPIPVRSARGYSLPRRLICEVTYTTV